MDALSSGLVLAEKPQVGMTTPTRLYDRSRYGNHMTPTNATPVRLPTGLWVWYFDGSDDKLEIADNISIRDMQSFSLSIWANRGNQDQCTLISKESATGVDGWYWRARTSSTPVFVVDYDTTNLTARSGASVSLSQWHHHVLTWTGSALAVNARHYVDAVYLSNSVTESDGAVARVSDSGQALRIGIGGGSAGEMLGYLGLAKIAREVIWTPAQVRRLYESERRLLGV